MSNDLSTILATLKPFRKQLAAVVVESTYKPNRTKESLLR